MSEQHRRRVRDLFEEAADLHGEARVAFLDTVCQSEPELRAEVESLLAHDSSFGDGECNEGFLRSPLVRAPETTLPGLSLSPQTEGRGLPTHIGRYRILGVHGEGGMGTVYAAEQDNPRRTVALKVIRSDFVSAALVNRFKHEAQILARLQHPGIAQVYEAGVSEDGRPFFAMEFIRGKPLDEYARGLGLEPPARLELLARICDAVQHAHDKGVIHRDLKPSNILVDDTGQPKVLDFGVARVTSADLLTTSSRTQTGQLLGTLKYMSPEQLTAHPGDIDGRSDVYTLGVILFELLAERLPNQLDQLPVHEVARVIEQQDAPRLGSIDKLYRGDVEIIAAKALEKEKTRRYATAGDLAADIRRHLRGEPILAQPIGSAERYWRWARRNPSIAALGSVLAGLLVLVTIASLLAASRFAQLAERAGRSANAERLARLEAVQARKTAEAASAAARAEAYRAVLAETKALRAAHQPGWREKALGELAQLAGERMPLRKLEELRTEATAALTTPDIRLLRTVDLPSDDLCSFAFSNDGRTLVTAGFQTGLGFWDVPGMRPRSFAKSVSVSEHRSDQAVYLLDEPGLAVGTRDRGVIFTDHQGVSTNRAAIRQGSSRPLRLAISGNGKRIVVAWTDGAGITVHELASGALLGRFAYFAFALSPDGRWLATENNGEIVLHPVTSGESRVVLGHQSGAHAFAFSPNGTILAAAFNDHTIVLWDVAKREPFAILRGHRERVRDVAFSPDGEWIATASLDYTVRIWEARTGQNIATLTDPGAVRRVQWSPTGDYLATIPDASRNVFL
jgi:predicted Ser/Thr protein kinase